MRNVRENFHETEPCIESSRKGIRKDEIRRDPRVRGTARREINPCILFILFTIFLLRMFLTSSTSSILLHRLYNDLCKSARESMLEKEIERKDRRKGVREA